MNERDFLTKMKDDILDTDVAITLDTKLDDIAGWDSLGYVSFIALAKASCGRKLDVNAVSEAKTLGDLFSFIK